MIRLLTVPEKKIPAILVLRQTFGFPLGEANRIVTTTPQNLPDLDSEREEEQLRKALEDAGCTLEKNFNPYDYMRHVSFYPPEDFKGPVCGSMYAFTTMCGEPITDDTPRVHSDLSDEERAAMTSNVDCPKCREALTNWGYLE